ncbi:MAG: hypothetical protein QMD71_00010 [bacterium]|nr:hypothetical protein [bacterium]
MKRLSVATVAFYIGVISLIVAVFARALRIDILGIWPSNIIHFANAWFLICLICYLHAIYLKFGEKKE